ncbi:MAG: hypothetical protein GY778_15150 [bacterium]|nr:hypothetical protein [bacterium]
MVIVLLNVLVILGQATAQPDAGRIDGILQRLEERGDSVDDLKCAVEYTIADVLADDEFTKFGEIRYQRGQENPWFYVNFEKMHQGGRVVHNQEWYLFDGRYFWEIKEVAKNKIRREVVRPGEKIDLFDIEDSPFPIPFGQKKQRIQSTFLVVLESPTSGDPPDTDHLICTPKPDSRLSKDFVQMEFFVSRDLHLPVKIVTVERGGTKINTAVFRDLKGETLTAASVNTGLKDADFDLPSEARTWKTIKEDLDPPAPLPGS